MRLRWKPDLNESLPANAAMLIPLVFDRFMSHRDRVVGFPNRKFDFHRMRIDGKPLRYALESYEVCFGNGYSLCFNQVKEVLELMGEIHDHDVAIMRSREFLRELRTLNERSAIRVKTRALQRLIAETRTKREAYYKAFCDRIELWENGNFRGRLLRELRIKADRSET